MFSKFWIILTTVFGLAVGSLLPVEAQEFIAPGCDIPALLEHQQEHAARLDNLAEIIDADLDKALEELYITGIAYQSLAIECGFLRLDEAVTEHMEEHQDTETVTLSDDEHHDTADQAAAVERALAVGDPVSGERLFNTIQPEAGFACATCHRVDTTERLIGPGLLGVGSPMHDPSEHAMANDNGMAGMSMGGDNHDSNTDNTDEMMMPMPMQTDPVEYLRTSILDPNAFIVPGFPDNLMPKNFGEIFTEDEINDLIAYLLTLE
ncbi:MAG: c-type cytochrome [Anaerolineae bacterium]|nr:c-type cytochrome [Anaerolineae bacterium]